MRSNTPLMSSYTASCRTISISSSTKNPKDQSNHVFMQQNWGMQNSLTPNMNGSVLYFKVALRQNPSKMTNIYTRIANFIAYGKPTLVSPVLMASSSIFYGATMVSKKSLMQKEYTQEQRATIESLNSFFRNILYALFSPLLGIIADSYGPANALIFVQFCMLSVLYINFKLKKMQKNT